MHQQMENHSLFKLVGLRTLILDCRLILNNSLKRRGKVISEKFHRYINIFNNVKKFF